MVVGGAVVVLDGAVVVAVEVVVTGCVGAGGGIEPVVGAGVKVVEDGVVVAVDVEDVVVVRLSVVKVSSEP